MWYLTLNDRRSETARVCGRRAFSLRATLTPDHHAGVGSRPAADAPPASPGIRIGPDLAGDVRPAPGSRSGPERTFSSRTSDAGWARRAPYLGRQEEGDTQPSHIVSAVGRVLEPQRRDCRTRKPAPPGRRSFGMTKSYSRSTFGALVAVSCVLLKRAAGVAGAGAGCQAGGQARCQTGGQARCEAGRREARLPRRTGVRDGRDGRHREAGRARGAPGARTTTIWK